MANVGLHSFKGSMRVVDTANNLPQGVGKSSLAMAAGNAIKDFGGTFFQLSPDIVKCCFVGESERYVKRMMEVVRENGPAILFLDEMETLCAERTGAESVTNSIKGLLVQELAIEDPRNKNLILVGACNYTDFLDVAWSRRFQQPKYLWMPQHKVPTTFNYS